MKSLEKKNKKKWKEVPKQKKHVQKQNPSFGSRLVIIQNLSRAFSLGHGVR